MLKWEVKKIIKDKSSIIALVLTILLFLQISFIKPMLETQNEYYDEAKNEYIVDNRSKDVIANEKLKFKVEMLKSAINSEEKDKTLINLNNEKLKLDNGSKYEDIEFYKVFSYRLDFSLSLILMIIIIVMTISNLYTDEEVSNLSPIILSSKEKNKVLYSKLKISILLPILIYGLYVCGIWLITYMQYGAPLNGNLQNYRLSEFALLMKPISINQYVIAKMITTTLMLIGISTVSMLVSFLSDNSVKSIGISVGFIAIGKILTLFRFLPNSILKVLSISNYIDSTMGMAQISGTYNGSINMLSKTIDLSNLCIVIYGLIIILAISGSIYSIKKVLVK